MLSILLGTNSSVDQIKEALNLVSKDPFTGSSIKWISSNPSIIATSGRVIRPRWNEKAEIVTLTAITEENNTEKYEFTVIPDEYIGDTMSVSDCDFFGAYKNGVWSTPGQFRYNDFPELDKVEHNVKKGNYEKAKEELLSYMRKKITDNTMVGRRNKLYADYVSNGVFENENTTYCSAEAFVNSSEYEKIEIPLIDHGIKSGVPRTYSLISKHRDSVELYFTGSNYPEENKRPMLKVCVNGLQKYYPVTKTAVIRGGKYKNTHCGTSDELTVKMFGEFLGDETYRALLQFDFSDISDQDIIEEAVLILNGKKSNDYSENKEFYVIKEPKILWNPDTVTWMDISGLYYNFNGIDGGNHWNKIEGANVEYLYQTIRFGRFGFVASEYQYSGDEKYAYSIIYNMLSFMASKDCLYTRPLDSNLRLNVWMRLFKIVINSKYMTPDVCTALIKRFFSSITAHANDTNAIINAAISKFSNVIRASSFFNEYTDSEHAKKIAIDFFNKNIIKDFFPDGAYVEDTGGYNRVAHNEYVNVKRVLYNEGIECSEAFDSRVRLGAYYNLLLRGPNGERLGFGDEPTQGKQKFNEYSEIVDWYGDHVLEYIDTQGEKGTKPSWTSICLPYSTYIFLRSDWTSDAHMLFTNVRHGSCHAHDDDNGIILFGYGKNLLTDAGYVDYEATALQKLGRSTQMHNTVEINNMSQKAFGSWNSTQDDTGITNAFETNERFDFVSQTSFGYKYIGNEHTRNITFVKPDFYIVSDIMEPSDKNEMNTYKQLWHMTPNSGLYIKDGVICSNYLEPGNIIIANADNCDLGKSKGPYTISYGGTADAPYAYYCKKSKGDVTFDTVLLPYKSKKSDLRVERIDIGVSENEVAALKIEIDKDGAKSTVYYLLQHKDKCEKIFGKYKTDAKMAIVIEDNNEKPTDFIIHDGSYIKSLNGNILKQK